MEKLFRGIALFLGIAYVLCGCGVQHIENSATVGVEMADVTETGRMPGLAEYLCCHEVYKDPEDGAEYWDFDICLPQFGENMPCYRELNAYFEDLYAQFLLVKELFYDRAKEMGENISCGWYEDYSYWGMTIGEPLSPVPVTFDLTTGEPVILPEILGCSEQETAVLPGKMRNLR